MRDVDEVRELGLERGVVEAERGHQAGAEVLEHDVARADQLLRRRQAFGGVDVEDDALLVAVERAEEADAEARQLARLVAAGRLDLDHLGAEVGEDHPAGRAHDHVRELDDADAVEGQAGMGRVGKLGIEHVSSPGAPIEVSASTPL